MNTTKHTNIYIAPEIEETEKKKQKKIFKEIMAENTQNLL